VRVRLRAERLDWVPAVLAWLDRPFVIEYPDALRGEVHALARRLAARAAATGKKRTAKKRTAKKRTAKKRTAKKRTAKKRPAR